MRKAVNHLKKCDPVLRAIIERVGPCRMQFGLADFCSVAEAIVYQQLNGKAAATIFKRFADLAGEPLTPEGILRLTDQQMRGVGLSKQKSSYLKDLAAKTTNGLLDFEHMADLPDEEVIKHLTQVKGIGVWTAHMFLDFFTSSTECAADRRLWRAGRRQEALQKAQAAEAEGYGKDRPRLGTISQRGLLVHVAESRHQDRVNLIHSGVICDVSLRL